MSFWNQKLKESGFQDFEKYDKNGDVYTEIPQHQPKAAEDPDHTQAYVDAFKRFKFETEHQKEVVRLHIREQLNAKQISEKLNCHLKATQKILQRYKQAVRFKCGF